MSQETFAALGVSAESIVALVGARHQQSFRDPVAGDPAGARRAPTCSPSPRPARARRWPSAIPLVERVPRDVARAAALVLAPTRELPHQVDRGDRGVARADAACGSRPSTAVSPICVRRRSRRRDAHILVATPGSPPGPARPRASSRSSGSSIARARRGRSDARHGVQAAGRPDRPAPPARPPDDVLLGDARRRGRRARAVVHRRRPPASRPMCRPSAGPARSSTAFVSVTEEAKVETLVELLEAERGLALVFVRTKRGADRLARKLARRRERRGDARRPDPGPARARARPVRSRGGDDARRDRRRRPRARPRRRHARDQLRPAGGWQGATSTGSAAPAAPGGPEPASPSSCRSSRPT